MHYLEVSVKWGFTIHAIIQIIEIFVIVTLDNNYDIEIEINKNLKLLLSIDIRNTQVLIIYYFELRTMPSKADEIH